MAAQITPLPTPPTPADTPADFNTKAFALLGGMPRFVTEANGLSDEVNQRAYTVSQDASAAQTAKNEAIDANTQAQLAKTSASEFAGSAGASAGAAAGSATAANLSAQAAATSAASIDTAFLRNRANHTGTQAQSTVVNLSTDLSALQARHRALGDGQTRQDVTSTRLPNVTYTNSTGRTIEFGVRFSSNAASQSARIDVAAVTRARAFSTGTGEVVAVAVIILAGETFLYATASTGTTVTAWEIS